MDNNGNPDGNVIVQMEISLPSSSLKSIVDSENVQLIPSSSSERPSISAAIVSSPPQILDSEASQLQPSPQPSPPLSSPDKPSPKMDINHTADSSLTSVGNLCPPSPPPPPPLPPASQPPPSPPPLVTISNTASPPPPPPPPPPASSTVTSTTASQSPPPSNAAQPPPPPPPPPSSSDNGLPVSVGLSFIPPGPPAAAPTAGGSIPPPPAAAGGSIPSPPAAAAAGGSIPPPPPPSTSSGGSVQQPPPPVQEVKGGAPPPPPAVGNGGKLLRKSVSKLKRSSQMGCLYRTLKAKVEGSGVKTKTLQRKDSKVALSSGGSEKMGMADALAEMTKRSSYFQQIEEDVKNYSDSVKEVQSALISFQTTDMDELIDFHKYVESHLEKLTDETQVLARFEDFPTKKLEGLRMAAALYSKLDAIADTLQNWDIEPPANQLLDRIENYFNKIKGELDTLDRTKDDEIKKFKSQKIHFDFAILIRIKELMVDVSSSCMELALKEKKLASASKKNGKKSSSNKTLWKAFQFAFRVYSFAGGQDERAENLTKEIAQQLQADNMH
ncbi:uncharacterized protein At4g04980-like [Bidens hawaiensis]|uniref:uncharacterized protein At4g04980-like n=1 Tax=Bidens hawaiensis TaxID=980011 RepID=UPI00404ACDEF